MLGACQARPRVTRPTELLPLKSSVKQQSSGSASLRTASPWLGCTATVRRRGGVFFFFLWAGAAGEYGAAAQAVLSCG